MVGKAAGLASKEPSNVAQRRSYKQDLTGWI
jgi:hypothetical protein